MTDTAVPGETLLDLRQESPQVHEVLSALGRLLGAAVRGPAPNLTSFVSTHLGATGAGLASVASSLQGVDVPLVRVAVGRMLDRSPRAVLVDDCGRDAPGYELVSVGVDDQVAAPDDLAAFLPAGDAMDIDCVLVLTWANGTPRIAVHVRRPDHARARELLADLLDRARGADNFYRGTTLRVRADDRGLDFTPVRAAVAPRDSLVLPDRVWAEIDANVRGLVAHGDLLAEAGLGAARGLLLAGPPGVGKTALCRVIAGELPAGTTVLLVDASATPRGLGRLWESLDRLAPAAVFLDDVDLLAGDRRRGTGGDALRELLVHLDGFAPSAAVLTVATTNDPSAIDPALVRAGRIDSVVEIGPPDRPTRARILRRYLRPVSDVSVERVAARTGGATGSDLREVVRRAVLERGRDVTEDDLLQIVESGRWQSTTTGGQYL